MVTIKPIAMSLIICIAAGCATVGTYQEGCEKQHSDFSEMVLCLKAAIAGDRRPAMSSDAGVKLYVLKAEQLGQQVQRGELTDQEARLTLQELYVRLRLYENLQRAR
jgi:hypothetical protein